MNGAVAINTKVIKKELVPLKTSEVCICMSVEGKQGVWNERSTISTGH